ncbi:AI-2E family transporter [Aporhodopirellula aestuarii]|uniref:AI-2E family transporter n=1 Tax=Aporhodopirellula aestuarii TaxID=2950107 RepID=A0ABT0U7Z4_9BACT|nr:AI-2E family transporter [Aporhodopirellula aestuarii]MCM2373035.1 AI-2E family transporter [Aporhodopirellula aestuarii]
MLENTTKSKSLILVTLLVMLVLAAAGVLIQTVNVLLLVLAGVLFGIFVNGIAGWLTKHTPLPYIASYLLIVTLMLVGGGLGVFYLGSQTVQRADQLGSELQSAVKKATDQLSEVGVDKESLQESFELKKMLSDQGKSALLGLLSGMRSVGSAITAMFVILFVGLYAAYEPDLYRTGILKLVPMRKRERGAEVLKQLNEALSGWIVGRLMSMAIVGVLTSIGLAVLGVPLPVTLGVVAALLTFIPNFGPLLAAVPQIMLALNVGSDTVVYVIVLNLALQGIESYVITPMIQRHEVTLPPILTIAAQLLMGVVVGVVGIMMAAPLVVVIMVFVQMLYVEDQLGDPHPGSLTSDA